MPRAYRTVRDHLDDIIGLARCIFEQHRTTKDVRLAELRFEIADRAEQIEGSLELARIASMPLPLDKLRRSFKLEPPEVLSLYLLLGLAVSKEVRDIAERDGTATLELLDQLVYASTPARDRFAEQLADEGRLFGNGLVEFADDTGSRFARPVRATDRVVELAFGRDRPTTDLADFATLTIARSLDVQTRVDARREVRSAIVRHVETGSGPIPVIRGVADGGRRAIVASVAHELGARMLLVHCGALPERAAPALTAIKREAILAGAVIVLGDAEHLAGDAQLGRRDRQPAVDAAFAYYSGPLAITVAPDTETANLMLTRGTMVVDIAPLSEAERSLVREAGDSESVRRQAAK